MSRIKAKNTNPELIVRLLLFSKGYRYRINQKNLPGKPDIVLPKYRYIIFVNGCFWHGHEGCRDFSLPKTRTEWWAAKINGNKKKDWENIEALKKDGWYVRVVWECELSENNKKSTIESIINELNSRLK